jgi:hypothetical protein
MLRRIVDCALPWSVGRFDTISNMKRSGTADLPLHGGLVPGWLADRMTRLGTAIVESVVQHYGVSAVLSRLANPFWFQVSRLLQ